jgi:hypothetical protein
MAHFPKIFSKMFCQKLTRIFGEKKTLHGMGQNHIIFKLDFGKNSPVKKSQQTNWFAFSQSILPTVANPSAHILDQVVCVCISSSVAQFHIIFWFLV